MNDVFESALPPLALLVALTVSFGLAYSPSEPPPKPEPVLGKPCELGDLPARVEEQRLLLGVVQAEHDERW